MKRYLLYSLMVFTILAFSFSGVTAQCTPDETACYDNNETDVVLFEITADLATITQGGYESCCDDLTVYSGAPGSGTTGTIVFGPSGGDLSGNAISTSAPGETLIFVSNSDGSVNCATGTQAALEVFIGTPPVFGCTDPTAPNYDATAICDDGSCIPPAPANDLCANATVMACGDALVGEDTSGSTNQSADTGCFMGDGIWYTFVGTGDAVTIDITNDAFDVEVAVMSGACGALTNISCTDGGTTSETTTFTSVIGTNYYFYIGDWSTTAGDQGTFDIAISCAPPAMPPANDLCAGAIPVTVDAISCTSPTTTGTNLGATDSGEIAPCGFGTYSGGDVWYSFTVPAGSTTVELDFTTTVGSLYGEVYSGSCGALTAEYCSNFLSTFSTEVISGLISGNTYFLRLFESGNDATGTFEFCIFTPPPPPVNDKCAGAIAYPGTIGADGTCPANNFSVNLAGTTEDSGTDDPSCDSFSPNRGVWYTYTATSSQLDFASGTGLPGIAVFTGMCGSLTEHGCLNNTSGSITGLMVGTTYLIYVWDDTAGTTIDFCLSEPACAPPAFAVSVAADDCANGNAVFQASLDVSSYGSIGMSNIQISDDQGTPAEVVNPGPSTPFSHVYPSSGLAYAAGTTVMFTVSDLAMGCSATVSYTFPTVCPPANDECANATVLACGDALVGEDTTGSTNQSADTGCSMGTGIWYTIAGTGDNITIDITNDAFDVEVAVMSGACGALTNISCTDGGTTSESTTFTSAAGTDYYIYVGDWSTTAGDEGTFDIAVTCVVPPMPPANDLCVNATVMACGDALVGEDTSASTNQSTDTGCFMGTGIWYTIAGTGDDITVDITNDAFDVEVAVMSGACGALTNISCTDGGTTSESTTFSSVSGTDYYIYVGDWSTTAGDEGTFDIAISCSCPGTSNLILTAPLTTTTALPANSCDDASGWTYYEDPGTGNYIFAINWAPDGSLSAMNAAAKAVAEVEIVVAPADGMMDDGTNATWTMKRGWNVNNSTALDEPVNVRFYYDPVDKAATDASASGDGRPQETSMWFKTVGTPWDGSPTPINPDPTNIALTDVCAPCTENGITYAQFDALASFSGGTWASGVGTAGASALPIDLITFTAKKHGEHNMIEWATASEINNDYMMVQKSNGTENWTEVGKIMSEGNTSDTREYVLEDRTPYTVSYYRLMSVDLDGSTQYSEVVKVERRAEETGWTATAVPNPTFNDINVNLTNFRSGTVDIILYDLSGRVVKQINRSVDNTNTSIEVSLTDLESGMYMMNVIGADSQQTLRIVKN